jgi:hypothetical protein
MHKLTKDDVGAFWADMTAHYGVRVVTKSSSWLMHVLALILSILRIVDKKKFLTRFATVLGKTVYIPAELGTPADGWSLLSQVVICIHECQHIVQRQRLGNIRYTCRYLFSSLGRAELEAEAYKCKHQFYHLMLNRDISPEGVLKSLRSYGLSDADLTGTAYYLTDMTTPINESTTYALMWFWDKGISLLEEDTGA